MARIELGMGLKALVGFLILAITFIAGAYTERRGMLKDMLSSELHIVTEDNIAKKKIDDEWSKDIKEAKDEIKSRNYTDCANITIRELRMQ